MPRNFYGILVLICVCTTTGVQANAEESNSQQKSYRGYQVLTVQASSAAQVETLNDLQNDEELQIDFFQVPCLNRSIDILVAPQHVRQLRRYLQRNKLTSRVSVDDMERMIDAERRRMRSRPSGSIWETYLTLTEMESWIAAREQMFPDNVKVSNMGTSVEGRNIYSVKVAANVNGPSKPAIWVECLAHAREWITTSACLGAIELLTENYGASSTLGSQSTTMLNKFDWYFVPVLNPDGYEYSHRSNRLWRKNRSNNYISFCKGTDLNRNWDASHCGTGASTSPCQDTYCGTAPQSEPENQALQRAVEGTPDVRAFFSIHSYSQLLLVPHAYANVRPNDYQELESIGRTAMAALEQVNGVSYQTGHAPTILYSASGGAFDYFKLNGVKYSYVYELRPATANQGGFELPEWNIDPSIRETFASFHSFAVQIPA